MHGENKDKERGQRYLKGKGEDKQKVKAEDKEATTQGQGTRVGESEDKDTE